MTGTGTESDGFIVKTALSSKNPEGPERNVEFEFRNALSIWTRRSSELLGSAGSGRISKSTVTFPVGGTYTGSQ